MAARLRARHQDDIRQKIQVGVIVDRLHKHVQGKIEMTQWQVRSAQILLDKSLASLQSVEHSGPDGSPLSIEIVRFGQGPAPK